ncbi:MAG: serine/threonine protein kinase, partial [Polyangiales bacterium]
MLAGMEPLKPGDTLARYRLERPLGAGGMGSVWLAVQEGLGRRVALKVMHPAIALDPSLAARFRQEAEVAASFNHPGIVPVTDFGVDEGRPFLVMDFLEGESLDAILTREAPLPPERVAFFAIQVLAALEAMHERKIVHRDLKPDNIFVSASSGVPDIARLLDFGIARVVERDGDAKMTTTGQILG